MPDLMQVAPPTAAWSYNNAGFSVSGRVMEAVTGTSINQAVRDLIFTPLGLAHAGSTAGEFLVNRFAAGHGVRNGAPFLQRPFSPSVSITAGDVGVCITDLLQYARFHLGDGTTPDGTLADPILLLEIVPEKNFAVGILTNSTTGWRLIQDVEREVLKQHHGATFPRNHAIAHRGLVETLPNVEPLATQPDPAPYVGRYLRPMNAVSVRVEGGRLVVQELPNGGEPRPVMPIAFFGPDRAVITDGNDRGQSIEFVRNAAGAVNWVCIVGRVAVRTN